MAALKTVEFNGAYKFAQRPLNPLIATQNTRRVEDSVNK
jgi:hypothetical protein